MSEENYETKADAIDALIKEKLTERVQQALELLESVEILNGAGFRVYDDKTKDDYGLGVNTIIQLSNQITRQEGQG